VCIAGLFATDCIENGADSKPSLIFQRHLLHLIVSMLAVALRRTVSKVVATTPKTFAVRAFSEERLSIPRDIDQQAGRKREEMDAEAAGQVGFNRDPIIPTDDAGTKENPILVRNLKC
jgi:hypothetical protein